MYEFPSVSRCWFIFFPRCQNNSIYKCFHELWGSYCSVCSSVALGQQLSWKNKTNPGPNRQTGLIKRPRVRKTLKKKLHRTRPLLCTPPGFPIPWPLSSGFIIFLINYLNMAISHLQLVFKEKATRENNHKLKSSECLQFWQDVKGLCLYQAHP